MASAHGGGLDVPASGSATPRGFQNDGRWHWHYYNDIGSGGPHWNLFFVYGNVEVSDDFLGRDRYVPKGVFLLDNIMRGLH